MTTLRRARDLCPEGSTCEEAAPFTRYECRAGRYCRADSTDGGKVCPTGVSPTARVLPWQLTTYCPAGLTTQFQGALSLQSMLAAGGWGVFACPAGMLCPNASSSEICPAGRYCELGANESLPCSVDWFRPSAEASCPPGSTEDLGSAYDQLIVLLAVGLPLVLLLEMIDCLLKRWARVRRMPVASDGAITTAKRSYLRHIREGYQRQSGWARRTRSRGRHGCDDSTSTTPSRGGSQNRMSTAVQHRVRNVTEVLQDATEDEIRYFNALTPAEAMAMPRDENVRWVMAALAMHPSDRSGSVPEQQPTAMLQPAANSSESATTSVGSLSSATAMASAAASLGDLLPSRSVRGHSFIHISLRGLNFHIGRVPILKELYADATQGQLVSLMGESGSGKSTLLNVLGGRSSYGEISVTETTGERTYPMLLNGAPFEPRRVRALIGFVPQAHIIYKELTVFENLAYASQMRAELSMDKHTRMRLVEMALDLLGLQECRHFVCDPSLGERLSGGQLRRIGIGIELVCDPPVMLLDEPTSALDAVNTKLVITALKDLTKRGILVIASLHQPRESVFNLFDKLWLMRKGGTRLIDQFPWTLLCEALL